MLFYDNQCNKHLGKYFPCVWKNYLYNKDLSFACAVVTLAILRLTLDPTLNTQPKVILTETKVTLIETKVTLTQPKVTLTETKVTRYKLTPM